MLEKRQLDLLVLIGCAILLPSIGGSIRQFIDSQMYIHLGVTLGLTIALFIIIMKYIKYVFPRRDKSINIQGDIV